MTAKSKWYPIVGGFSSGKTSVVEILESMGYAVVPNASRVLIEANRAKGIPTEVTRRDEAAFQRLVLKKKLEDEGGIDRNRITFLDNAVPCSIPYFFLNGIDPQEALKFCEPNLYVKVFLMEQLPYKHDGVRTETEEFMRKLNGEMRKAYEALGYEVIDVPVAPTKEEVVNRVKLILSHVI
mgnify:CR=1 FL=1